MSYLRLMNTTMGCNKYRLIILVVTFLTCPSWMYAWDHPSHMTTAAIAFGEIERARPELIEKLELVFMAHPDTSPF